MARNNQRRTNRASTDEAAEPAASNPVPASVLDFVTPTEFVDLPSAGRFYGTSHPLHNQETVEIRYMTAKDEDILTSQTLLRKGIALEKFLQNVIIDKSIDPGSLLIGDRNAILVAARITGYGAEYETKTVCPGCGAKYPFSFDLNQGNVYAGDDLEGLDTTLTKRGTFVVSLPFTKVKAEIRLLTGADETAIAQSLAKRKKASALESSLTRQLARCIVALNDDTDQNTIQRFAELMPAFDSRHIRKAIKAVTPNLDLTQDFQCSECNHEQEMEVPFTVDFFWPNR